MKTRAKKHGNEYVLNGTKQFITHGSVAGTLVVFAETEPGNAHRGISAFVLERETSPWTVARVAVDGLQKVAKDAFPTASVYGKSGDPSLRLVTCGRVWQVQLERRAGEGDELALPGDFGSGFGKLWHGSRVRVSLKIEGSRTAYRNSARPCMRPFLAPPRY